MSTPSTYQFVGGPCHNCGVTLVSLHTDLWVDGFSNAIYAVYLSPSPTPSSGHHYVFDAKTGRYISADLVDLNRELEVLREPN